MLKFWMNVKEWFVVLQIKCGTVQWWRDILLVSVSVKSPFKDSWILSFRYKVCISYLNMILNLIVMGRCSSFHER